MDAIPLSLPPVDLSHPEAWRDRFTHLCETHPDDTAVICGDHFLSYRKLGARADSISSLLRSYGIGPGDFVGLAMNRCLDLPAALLGILGSGAAYIPLDPSYPPARIARMIETSGIRFILTSSEHAPALPASITAILLDSSDLSTYSRDTPPYSPSPHDFIYAIFTSGSTGDPKAATVFHRGFGNLLNWYARELKLDSRDRTLIISSPSFDLTQKNFYAPLLSGGAVVLDAGSTYDIPRITGIIRDHDITLINCTPSAFYPLVDAAAAEDFRALSSLRFAVLGGEPISIPRLRAWLEHPNCRAEVVNSYGPTECTDICAFHRLSRHNLEQFPFVPLGREIPNVTVSIRGESMETLPIGEIGELCIGGVGVGAGYLHDPTRTSEAFIHGLYRTGDLARRLPDGNLEFRGRADHQVKINGFRIELGEIEIALEQHEAVQEAVVIAHDQRLIAHIRGDFSPQVLRDHLATRLPAYMVPTTFLKSEGFPLTPNGKVDRLLLARTPPPFGLSAPAASSLEAQILALWSEILGRHVADPEANFFDLGGSSIHVAIVHVRLMEMTGRDFFITELFARPSARAIAAFLSPVPSPSPTGAAVERARLAQASISRFRRPSHR